MATPKQNDPQFKLRLTQPLKDKIEMAASVSNRSMNSEIVHRLEASFESVWFEVAVANEVVVNPTSARRRLYASMKEKDLLELIKICAEDIADANEILRQMYADRGNS